MRPRLPILVLLAWLAAGGAQWDLLQSFAWSRMIVRYSRTMPLDEAVRLTFTPDNLCGVCVLVADLHTRADAETGRDDATPAPAKAKAPLAPAPEYRFVFALPPEPEWPRENFTPDACARPAPPTEPPRAA